MKVHQMPHSILNQYPCHAIRDEQIECIHAESHKCIYYQEKSARACRHNCYQGYYISFVRFIEPLQASEIQNEVYYVVMDESNNNPSLVKCIMISFLYFVAYKTHNDKNIDEGDTKLTWQPVSS